VPLLSTIPSDCRRAFLTDQFVLTHHPAQINICNFQGNVKQTLDFPESEGYIEHLTLFQGFLSVSTNKNFVKMYDLTRREAKQTHVTRRFADQQGKSLGTALF